MIKQKNKYKLICEIVLVESIQIRGVKINDVILEENISVNEFLDVIESVGFKTYSKNQAEKALKNTMYMVKTIVDGKVVGIGRVVGDFSIVCCLSDICVRPEYQGKGIGLRIVNKLKIMIEDRVKEGANLIKCIIVEPLSMLLMAYAPIAILKSSTYKNEY